MAKTRPHDLLLEFVRARDVTTRHGARALEENDYLLRSPEGDGTYVAGAFRWDLDVAEALAGLDNHSALKTHVDALARLLRRFLEQAEWSRIDARIRESIAQGERVRITMRSAAAELYLLPWEFLSIDDKPQCEAPNCLLRYEWPRDRGPSPPAAAPPREGGRILVAWSGLVPAAEHVAAIEDAAREAHFFFDRSADVIPAATLSALTDALADEERPVTALHLLCHGTAAADRETGTLVYALDMAPDVVLPADLRAAVERARSLRLVVLCACEGGNPGALDNKMGSVAQQIHRAGVEAVVSSRYPWTTEASCRVVHTFYRDLLVELRSVEEAFLRAQAAEAKQPGMDHAAMTLYGFSERGYEARPVIVRPYRGLKALSAADSRLLFGRDAERAELLDRVARGLRDPSARFLIIAGASGSGKSSLAMAGLAADLCAGRLAERLPKGADAPGFRVVVMRPTEGSSPEATLRARLDEMEDDGRMRLVVVDQLEEIFTLFTQGRGRREQEAFLRALLERAADPAQRCFVVGTLRMEYLGHFGALRGEDGAPLDSISLDPAHHFLVRQLTPAQYHEIVAGPCERCGVFLEPGLAERIVAAAGAEPGALPLVAYAMDRLWELRERKTVEGVTGYFLTDDAYTRIGEIKGALAARFDEVIDGLSADEQAEARRLLVQLVRGAEDPSMATRRRRERSEVRPGGDEEPSAAAAFDRAAAALVDGRLCVTGQDSDGGRSWIEIAHEAIVRGAPTLLRWLSEARDWVRSTDELRERCAAWEPHSGAETAPDYLLAGRRLADARAAWARHGYHLGAMDRRRIQAFLDASQAEEDRRARALEEQRQRELSLARRAREFALVAGARELLAKGSAKWASKLLLESRDWESTRGWLEIAKAVLNTPMPAVTIGPLDRNGLSTPRFTPDGSKIVVSAIGGGDLVASVDGKGAVEARSDHGAPEPDPDAGRISPDKSRVIVVEAQSGVAWIERADGGGERVALQGHSAPIDGVAWSPDNSRVATAAPDHTVRLWNADGSGEPLVLQGHDRDGYCEYPRADVAFSPDGRLLATSGSDGAVCIWRLDDRAGEPVVALGSEAEELARAVEINLDPDSERCAIAIEGETIHLRSCDGEREARVPLEQQENSGPEYASFSPDGRRVAIMYGYGDFVSIIDLSSAVPPFKLKAPGYWLLYPSWSGDGRRVITKSDVLLQSYPKAAHVWSAEGPAPPIALAGHEGSLQRAALSHDGERAITATVNGVVRVWDLSAARIRARLEAANADCLPPALRVMYLDESEAEAEERYAAAMRARGRPPIAFDDERAR